MQKRSGFVRGVWAAGGIASFCLGAVGSVLPILPTTPFILLAAFCFARSSDRLNEWFKGTKLYAKVFEGFVTKRCMTVKAKLSIIIPVTMLMGIGFALMGNVPVGRVVLAIVWAAHVAYFGFVVKTDRGEDAGSKADDQARNAGPGKKRSKMPMIKTEVFELLADSKRYIWLQVLWKTLGLAAQIAIACAAAHLLQRAYEGGIDARALAICSAIVIVGIAVRAIADSRETQTAYLASIDVKRILRGRIYGKLLKLGASYRESVATSKVVQLAVEGVEQLETYCSLFIPQFFYAFAAPLILFFVIGPTVSWGVAGILLLFVPLIPVSIMAVQVIAKKLLSRYWGQYTKLGDTFLECLQGLTTLKIYQADEQAAARMDRDSEDFRIATMNVLKMQLNSTSIMDIGAYGGAAAGMIVALMQLFSGELAVGGCVAVLLLAAEFFLPMRRLGSYFHVGMNGMAACDSIFDLLELPERTTAGARPIEGDAVAFVLDRASFTYDGERTVLSDASMSFPAASLTSIVGASGCGKSTVANLLVGRNRGYTGSITVNGQELAETDEASLMRHVTIVSRSSHLFKGSVRANLLLGSPEAGDAELYEALAKVRLRDFVAASGGLDMPLDEDGGNLSGGQRQRLVLARALLHDTPAYVFDEATSSIDVESEELIMQVVRELSQERTVVLISHRLANVVSSDAIYLMEEGRVAECGTHAELMARSGKYAALFAKQQELEAFSGMGKRDDAAFKGSLEPVQDTFSDRTASMRETLAEPTRGASEHRAHALSIMGRLIGLVRSMTPVMCVAIFLGVAGFACAIFLTVIAGYGLAGGALSSANAANASPLLGASPFGMLLIEHSTALFFALAGMAVARGLLHYGEQYCNHYIAFKMLAIVRHKVFAKLRTLAPAKLEGRDKGDLISLITGDVELLEVFYAHTISPIAIASLVSLAMVAFLWMQHWLAGLIALAAYLCVGVLLPVWNSRRIGDVGLAQRNAVGRLNAYILDSLYGLDETIQFDDGEARAARIDAQSLELSGLGGEVNRIKRNQVACTDLMIQLFSWGMLFSMLALYLNGAVGFAEVLIATLALMGSFGPVVALSDLSTTLAGTLASGHRVLDLIDEEPATDEIAGREAARFGDVALEDVSFAYDGEDVLVDFSLAVRRGSVVGIHGPSGSGKSTVCKLIMRFWDVQTGHVEIGGRDVRDVNTDELRGMESYVTQDTWLFHETIADNIALGKPDASREAIADAARKASLHEFIEALPDGYDTMVGELGDTLSDGERQRLGLARAFLHDAPLMLLDEPTSNLDSLNEAVILKSLSEMCEDSTVVLVSHRVSTLALADRVVHMEARRAS